MVNNLKTVIGACLMGMYFMLSCESNMKNLEFSYGILLIQYTITNVSSTIQCQRHDPLEAVCVKNIDLYYDHKCYSLIMEEMLWHDAQTHCMNLGSAKKSHLAIITSSGLAEKIRLKWPNLVTRYEGDGVFTGGIMTAARMHDGTVGTDNTGDLLEQFYWYTTHTEYEDVLVSNTYMPVILRASDGNSGNAFVVLEHHVAGSSYTRADRALSYWSTFFLCQRDNFYRRFRKQMRDKRMIQIIDNEFGPFHVCIASCSRKSICVAFNFKLDTTGGNQHRCQLSALKSQDNAMDNEVGFEVWDVED